MEKEEQFCGDTSNMWRKKSSLNALMRFMSERELFLALPKGIWIFCELVYVFVRTETHFIFEQFDGDNRDLIYCGFQQLHVYIRKWTYVGFCVCRKLCMNLNIFLVHIKCTGIRANRLYSSVLLQDGVLCCKIKQYVS